MRPPLAPTLKEYFEIADDIPVEDGGQFASEDGPAFTQEMAEKEAKIIMRIEKEAEPGGLLTERCSIFEPEPVEEPPRQWAHQDHMVKAMANFRRLMVMEQQRHRATAKKLAEACQQKWRDRQPKSAEDLEREARVMWELRYRGVVKVMSATWENVKVEVNQRRREEWEAAEQRRVQAALQQAVNLSEQKLLARQAQFDSDGMTDEEDLDEEDEDLDNDEELGSDADLDSDVESGDDENNMSSSDEDDDQKSVASDEGLTQDQLREKYANLPSIEKKKTRGDPAGEDGVDNISIVDATATPGDETSDESVDMDDDMGSTDMDSDDDDQDGSDGDVEESDEEDDKPSGLLGLFFDKKELKELKEEVAPEAPDLAAGGVAEDTEMASADPASPHAESEAVATTIVKKPDQEFAGPTSESLAGEESVPVEAGGGGTSQNHHPHSPSDIAVLTNGDVMGHDSPSRQSTELVSEKVDLGQSQAGDASSTTGGTADETTSGRMRNLRIDTVGQSPKPASAAPLEGDPQTAMTAPPSEAKQTSPETDANTNPASPRSQSPQTSNTKPSDIDTTSSVEQVSAPGDASRSSSPQPGSTPRTDVPFLLRGQLREYQHYGLDWLAGLYAKNTNGILADEMGLGKTIQTIALLAHLAAVHEVWGPHLVIVPTSVMLNWEMEFKKWCPGFKILTYYGTQEERKRKRQGWTNDDVWNVCITSYQIVLQDQQVFKRRRWHYMILDEAHNIKNFRSQRWQTLLGFNTHSRLLLTGTPLQNNLMELWSLLYFLTPPRDGEGGFSDLQEFSNWFNKPESQILESGRDHLDKQARETIAKLHTVIRPYLLRRLKADVEKQMPAKIEHVEFCRLSKRQRELYDGFLARSETRDTLSSGNYLSIINCLMQLRKVCNHPDLFVDRPIMTSFRMEKSIVSDYNVTEQTVRSKLLTEKPMSVVSLGFLNLIPTQHEGLSSSVADRINQLSSHRALMDLREAQKTRAQSAYHSLDPSTVKSTVAFLDSAARWGRFEELQHCVYLNALRRQQKPIYGQRLRDFLTIGIDRRPYKPRPRVPKEIMGWFEEDSFVLRTMIPTLDQRAASMEGIISKFACVTPAVVTRDMDRFLLGTEGVNAFEETDLRLSAPVKILPFQPRESPLDPWHESRMRLSIQFPDKRLLQYDCGKLQALDKLLRKLQAGGHRALIFTQMTKVLDILEQFLNIHGHKYLRLDGSTKVEQRQILTDRFNVDTRILCFILSTRSGGLGLNLTGADTVIFYDQDWNPAMDKQCQDRCHRIGQTRDVHIYRLISEHTIEANILRKASQKQMLDDVVIQEGEFTTDYFNRLSVQDVIGDANGLGEHDAAANAAMDLVLGEVETVDTRTATKTLERAEDAEDVAAARAAEKEIQEDEADFSEKPASGVSTAVQGTPRECSTAPASASLGRSGLGLFAESGEGAVEEVEPDYNAWGTKIESIDDYMLKLMSAQLEGTPLELPRDKKKSKKKGKDTRKR